MSSNTGDIDATDVRVDNLFSKDYLFKIPQYQRPFSWGEEQFEDLVDDVKNSLLANEENPDRSKLKNYESYFLGSVILREDSESERFDVVDGQQRLTSLTILFAVLRDLRSQKESFEDDEVTPGTFHDLIMEEGNALRGISAEPRLNVRESQREFFNKYVYEEGGTEEALDVNGNDISEPEERIITAIELFRDKFIEDGELDQDLIARFGQHLVQNVVFVEIKATSLSSAFRLFNITNARGVPLTNADLLKSENLGHISEDKRKRFANKWEELEEEIGREDIERLISFIRHLKIKEKAQKSIYDEYMNKVFVEEPEFMGEDFFDYLFRIGDIYKTKIKDAEIETDDTRKIYYYNLVTLMHEFFPSEEWMTALIRFHQKYQDDEKLFEFVKKLERKVATDWVSGLTSTERLTQVYKIVDKIEVEEDPDEVIQFEKLNDLNETKKENFKDTLEAENFYRKGNYRMAKYTLLRADLERYDNNVRKTAYEGKITVEHILPQTPDNDYWQERFPESFRIKWTDKLGNLVLLEGRKNSSASNKPYSEKVDDYFENKSDFAVTNDLDSDIDWTPEELKSRHSNLKQEITGIWF